jgi:hypothetical protein
MMWPVAGRLRRSWSPQLGLTVLYDFSDHAIGTPGV